MESKEEKLTPEKVALLYQAIPHMTDEQKRNALAKIKVFKKNGYRSTARRTS